ncbi:MAG: cadherin repeat domain-containing protein [Verrucomicrobiota bacterium]
MRKLISIAAGLFVLCLAALPAMAAIRYVDTDATGNGTGTSWDNAYPELVTALNAAVAGDEIWIAEGTYRPDFDGTSHTGNRALRFNLKSDISIYGGFSGTETLRSQRDWVAHRTILSGDIGAPGVSTDNTRTIMASNTVANNVLVEGVTFVGGRADDPAEGGNGIVGGSGGAVYLRGSATFRHCTFLDNYAVYGGAIDMQSAQSTGLTVINCLFVGNRAQYVGGALLFQSSIGLFTVTNSTIINNSSSRGSAIGTNTNVTCVYSNNLIHSNPSSSSYWKTVETGSSLTASGNVSEVVIGTGSAGNLVVANARLAITPSPGADGVWGTADDIAVAIPSIDSPVIGAGNPALVPADSTDLDGDGNVAESMPLDLQGEPRIANGTVDAGAFAFINHPATAITLSNADAAENQPAGLTVGTLGTLDPDGGTNAYTLVAGEGSDHNSLFSIVDGDLVTAAPLDYETASTLSIRVRSTDIRNVEFEQALTITVLDRVDPTVFDFTLGQSQLGLSLVPTVSPEPVRIALDAALPDFDFAGVQVGSDASWVTGSVDADTGELVLSFGTSALLNSSYTATLTLTNAEVSQNLTINATLAPLSIIALRDDPTRSRMYGIHQNGSSKGSIVIINPLSGQIQGSVTVGAKPADMAISDDGNELLVLCSISKDIHAIDLRSLRVTEVISVPDFFDWGGDSSIPSGHIAYGPDDIIYFVDGAWGPVMRVLKRSTGQIIQSLIADGRTPVNEYGFGDFALSSDKTSLYAWVQYGWSAGYAGSYVVRHAVNADGTLTYLGKNTASYPNFQRDPLDTPVLISRDDTKVIAKTLVMDPETITTTIRSFSSPVYAISPNAEIAMTATDIREMATGNLLHSLPVSSKVQAVSSDYARLVYFNSANRTLGTVNLLETVGAAILGRDQNPSDGAIILSPSSLSWSPLPGIDRYRVYLGTSLSDITAATVDSPEYRGEITATTFLLGETLTPGTTYHWRIDPVSENEVSRGPVSSFTVSTLSASQSRITGSTVTGHTAWTTTIDLVGIDPDQTWSAHSADGWLSFVESTGTTPGTLQIKVDASQLAPGVHTTSVEITSQDITTTLPVSIVVDPRVITLLKNRAGTTKVYAISEVTNSKAYLIELDALQKRILRVAEVGQGVTDFAIHEADNRIYVTNWNTGNLVAVGLDDFTVERTFGYDLPSSNNRDVYKVSPAGTGRLIFEPEDQ